MYLSTEVSDKSVLLDGLVNGGAATFFHVAREYCPTVLQMVRVQDPESLFYIARKWYPSCVCAVVSTNQIESIPDTEMERWNQLLPQDKLAFSDQWAFVSNETRKIRVDSVTYAWLQIGGLILQTASPAALDDARFRHKRGGKTDLILDVIQDEKLKGNAATFSLFACACVFGHSDTNRWSHRHPATYSNYREHTKPRKKTKKRHCILLAARVFVRTVLQ
jgi:hypothetical protein